MNRRKTLSLGLVSGTLLSAVSDEARAALDPTENAVRSLVELACEKDRAKCKAFGGTDKIFRGATVKLPPELAKLHLDLLQTACKAIESYYAARGLTLSFSVTGKS